MKHLLLLALLLLPVWAHADGGLAAAGLGEALEVFGVVWLVLAGWLGVLGVASLRRPDAPGLLRRFGLLLAALAGACGLAALLQFFLKPLLALVVVALLLLGITLARQARTEQ